MTLLKTICYLIENSFKNQSTIWGSTHENDVKAFYSNKLKTDHINFSFTQSELIINSCFPFIGACLDGTM